MHTVDTVIIVGTLAICREIAPCPGHFKGPSNIREEVVEEVEGLLEEQETPEAAEEEGETELVFCNLCIFISSNMN